jgi:[protein-PII] uridylyltransferase
VATSLDREACATARREAFGARHLPARPLAAVHAFSAGVDILISRVFAESMGAAAGQACVVALGGYGRAELCPYSDVDILLLHADSCDGEAVGRTVRALWDSGLTLGCVVRTLGDCRRILGDDLATDVAYLECRHVTGAAALSLRLRHDVLRPYFRRRRDPLTKEFLSALRDGLFGTRSPLYVVEPDVKNGVCGLRDCQRMLWAHRTMTGELEDGSTTALLPAHDTPLYQEAYAFLLGVRTHLHLAAGRRLDILELALQEGVGYALDLDGPAALMEQYFRTVRNVKHCILTFLEHCAATRRRGATLRQRFSSVNVGPHLRLLDGIIFGEAHHIAGATPVGVLAVFETALACSATLSVELENAVRSRVRKFSGEDVRTSEVDLVFRNLLSADGQVGATVSQMHDTGLLGLLIPGFATLTCKVEYDSYHEYTVDEHILLCLRGLDTLTRDPDPALRARCCSLPRRHLLRLALLLHDIGKAAPGAHHAASGAVIAASVCDRLGLTQDEKGRVVRLVATHLELSRLAFSLEPEDAVVRKLARLVGDAENLDMLYLLTVLDIRNVGRRTWTDWKGVQLEAAYLRVRAAIEGVEVAAAPEAEAAGMSPMLPQEHELHQRLRGDLVKPHDLVLHLEPLPGFERITVCAFDRPHLFADIAACLAAEGYGILSARLSTDDNGTVLDVFDVEPDGTTDITPQERSGRVRARWVELTAGTATATAMVEERGRRYPPRPLRAPTDARRVEVHIDNTLSARYTAVEVSSPDRFGLAWRIAESLSEQGVNIVAAWLATRVDRAADVFYVTDAAGAKITDERRAAAVANGLRRQLESP